MLSTVSGRASFHRLGSRSGARGLGVALVLALGLPTPGCLDPEEPGNLVPPTVDEDPALPRLDVTVLGGLVTFPDVAQLPFYARIGFAVWF